MSSPLEKVDWKLLHDQKLTLLAILAQRSAHIASQKSIFESGGAPDSKDISSVIISDADAADLEGIIGLLDGLIDYAADILNRFDYPLDESGNLL